MSAFQTLGADDVGDKRFRGDHTVKRLNAVA
jgi:hypothetical protein